MMIERKADQADMEIRSSGSIFVAICVSQFQQRALSPSVGGFGLAAFVIVKPFCNGTD